MTNARHHVGLDGLRGFAALSVVLFHLDHWLGVPWLATNAHFAVDLFFCLSGYVLASAYGRAKAPDLSFAAFARLRLVRLMPIIVLAVPIGALGVIAHPDTRLGADFFEDLAAAVALGLLVLPDFGAPPDIGGPQLFPLNGPQYSLFLELLVNAVWFAAGRFTQLPLALALSTVSLAAVAVLGGGGDTPATFWNGFLQVSASYFAGVAIFQLAQGPAGALARTRGASLAFWLAAGAMAILFFLPVPVGPPIKIVWIAIVSPLLVLTGTGVVIEGSARRLCLAAGALSYPLYALHKPIFRCLHDLALASPHRPALQYELPLDFVGIVALSALALVAYDTPARAALARRREARADDTRSSPASIPAPALSAP